MKVYKKQQKDWHQWNKGLTIDNPIVAEYSRKCSITKKKNPKYKRIAIENRLKSAKLEGKVTTEEIRKLYWEENLSSYDIAKKLNVTPSAIILYMQHHNIPNRGRRDSCSRWRTPKEEVYKKVSKAMKGNRSWASCLYKRGGLPNKTEQKLIDLFREFDIPLKYVGNGVVVIDGKNPDFINFEGMKILEYDEDYWHSIRPEGYDEQRNEVYRRNGFDLLVLTGEDLNSRVKLVGKVKKWFYE